MNESRLLAHIYARSSDLSAAFPRVLVGPGDDCAIVKTAPRSLLKTDQVVEGVHFISGTPIDLIARKAVARPLSDIAAMAGTPVCALAACALPPGFAGDKTSQLFDDLAKWGRIFGAPLVGGDIAWHAQIGAPLSLTITVIGDPNPARDSPLRSVATVGDWVYVTGALGGSLGVDSLGRHLRFEPRVHEARFLAQTFGGDLHAMMDISDGLGMDAARIAAASGVSIRLNGEAIPIHADARTCENPLKAAIHDGEDYELLFTTAPNVQVPATCAETGTSFTRIGTVTPRTPIPVVLLAGGREMNVSEFGWDPRG